MRFDMMERFLAWRGVKDPCIKCKGVGNFWYDNTTTWREGAGGQGVCLDVCNACWGTGDAGRRGVDLKALFARAEAAEAEAKIKRNEAEA